MMSRISVCSPLDQEAAQVLGGRELLEHECVGHLPREKDTGHLHVYVKLSDLSSFTVSTAAGQSFTYRNPSGQSISSQKSALTTSLAEPSNPKSSPSSKRCVPRCSSMIFNKPGRRSS